MTMEIVFLLGLMRSGTTYFRNVLASNRNILSLGSELSGFWTRRGGAPAGKVEYCPYLTGEDLDERTADNVRKFFQSQFRKRNLPHKIAFRRYRKWKYGNETLIKNGTPFYLLNKSTHLHNKIAYLDDIFPQAKYIFIIRDPHSQVNSLNRHFLAIGKKRGLSILPPGKPEDCWRYVPRKRSGENHLSLIDLVSYWFVHNRLALESLDRISVERVHYVHYEDLATDLESVLSGLDRFLGLSLNRHVDRKLFNNTTSAPLTSWRTDMPKEQVIVIDEFIDSHREDYNFILGHSDR